MDSVKVIIGIFSGAIITPIIVVVLGYLSQGLTNISPDAGAQFDSIMLPAINLITALPTELFVLLGAILGALGTVGVVKLR